MVAKTLLPTLAPDSSRLRRYLPLGSSSAHEVKSEARSDTTSTTFALLHVCSRRPNCRVICHVVMRGKHFHFSSEIENSFTLMSNSSHRLNLLFSFVMLWFVKWVSESNDQMKQNLLHRINNKYDIVYSDACLSDICRQNDLQEKMSVSGKLVGRRVNKGKI